jgi:hypothetical protein
MRGVKAKAARAYMKWTNAVTGEGVFSDDAKARQLFKSMSDSDWKGYQAWLNNVYVRRNED